MLALIVQDWSTLISLFDSRTPSCGHLQREDGDPDAEAMNEPNEDRPVPACQLASVESIHIYVRSAHGRPPDSVGAEQIKASTEDQWLTEHQLRSRNIAETTA